MENRLIIIIVFLAILAVVVSIILSSENNRCKNDADNNNNNKNTNDILNFQYFSLDNYPMLPGNTRNFTVPFPVIFNNNPRYVSIEVKPLPYTVAPPVAIVSSGITRGFFDLTYFRNEKFNFVDTPLAPDGVNIDFLGTSSLPFDSANNVGIWSAVVCTSTSMNFSTGTLQNDIDQLFWTEPVTVATMPTDDFEIAANPISMIGARACAWACKKLNQDIFQVELVDASSSLIDDVIRYKIGSENASLPITIVGTQTSMFGSTIVVAFDNFVTADVKNKSTDDTFITKKIWEAASDNEICLGAAWSQSSTVFRVILTIRDTTSDIYTFILLENIISSSENIWANLGSVQAPQNNGFDTVVNVFNDFKLGEIFIYSSFENMLFITRVPINWSSAVTSTYELDDENGKIKIAGAQLFGFNRSPAVIYLSTPTSIDFEAKIGIVSFSNSIQENKEIKMLSNVQQNAESVGEVNLSVSSLTSVDSLILATDVAGTNTKSFLLFATISANVLAVR
jgi:hypothetical protein